MQDKTSKCWATRGGTEYVTWEKALEEFKKRGGTYNEYETKAKASGKVLVDDAWTCKTTGEQNVSEHLKINPGVIKTICQAGMHRSQTLRAAIIEKLEPCKQVPSRTCLFETFARGEGDIYLFFKCHGIWLGADYHFKTPTEDSLKAWWVSPLNETFRVGNPYDYFDGEAYLKTFGRRRTPHPAQNVCEWNEEGWGNIKTADNAMKVKNFMDKTYYNSAYPGTHVLEHFITFDDPHTLLVRILENNEDCSKITVTDISCRDIINQFLHHVDNKDETDEQKIENIALGYRLFADLLKKLIKID